MKIIIAPSNKLNDATQHSATIEHASDDLNVEEAFQLFASAMVAYGYHHKNVKDCLEKDLGENIFGVDK